jgi:hypothetical protein
MIEMVSLGAAADHGIATEPEPSIVVARPFLAILVRETCSNGLCEAVLPKGRV